MCIDPYIMVEWQNMTSFLKIVLKNIYSLICQAKTLNVELDTRKTIHIISNVNFNTFT
jgi:hypothetical protein